MLRRALLFLVVPSLLLASCKEKSVLTASAVSHDVSARGFNDVVKTLDAEKYTPPADGHLTGEQIQNFIKIRQRAKVIEDTGRRALQEQSKKMEGKDASLTDLVSASRGMGILVTADVRASQELGLNSAEYEWVKQQIVDASSAAISDQSQVVAQKVAAADQADLRQHLADAPDEESKKIYAGMIADSEKTAKEAQTAGEPQTAAVIYNKELLAKYEDAVRPLMEVMMSGTGHEEEIQKAITDSKKFITGAEVKAP